MIMLNVIKLSVVLLSVVVPHKFTECKVQTLVHCGVSLVYWSHFHPVLFGVGLEPANFGSLVHCSTSCGTLASSSIILTLKIDNHYQYFYQYPGLASVFKLDVINHSVNLGAACGCMWLHVAACGCMWLHVAACGCMWLHVAACGCMYIYMSNKIC